VIENKKKAYLEAIKNSTKKLPKIMNQSQDPELVNSNVTIPNEDE
jgi:hypothetical protein